MASWHERQNVTYLTKLKTIADVPEQAECALVNAADRLLSIEKGQSLEAFKSTVFIVDGWAGLVRLGSSSNRMILQYALPGDLIFSVARDDIGWVALTDAAIFRAPSIEAAPTLAAAYDRSRRLDCLNYENHIARCGFMTATDCMLDFMVEVDARASLTGHRSGAELRIPLAQTVVGELLGMTSIHVNRTRRQIIDGGQVTLRHRSVQLGPELTKQSERRRAAYLAA